MNDRLFELRHQRLMDVQHDHPDYAWPENALRALEAIELEDLEHTQEVRDLVDQRRATR